MFDLIEIELTRVRRMAEHTDDGLLLYLIDIAIKANAKARSGKESRLESMNPPPLKHNGPRSAEKCTPEMHIVH
jgi:hypothetical protein